MHMTMMSHGLCLHHLTLEVLNNLIIINNFLTQTGLEFGVYKGKWQNLHPGDGGTEILRGLVFLFNLGRGGGYNVFTLGHGGL